MVAPTHIRKEVVSNIKQKKIARLNISPEKLAIIQAATTEQPQPKRQATAAHLSFSDLSHHRSNWTEAKHGVAKIGSPISIFPKPLALQLVNYHTHYKSYKFSTTTTSMIFYERLLVAGYVTRALLAHYFPTADYDIVKMFNEEILKDVPMEGTQYYIIVRKHEDRKHQKVRMIFAVVAHPKFTKMPDRHDLDDRLPLLSVNPQYTQGNNRLNIENMRANKCSIVLLTGRMYPEQPSMEFWQFGSEGVTPFYGLWADEMGGSDPISSHHSFSMDSSTDFEKIDQLFCAASRLPVGVKTESGEAQSQVRSAREPAP